MAAAEQTRPGTEDRTYVLFTDNIAVIVGAMNAGRIVRYARRRAGLSQRALADASGVAQPAIARIERGVVTPRVDTLERLLAATGSSLELSHRLGDGVDRSLIRASLGRTAEERVTAAGLAGSHLTAFLEAAKHAKRH